jgi:hypothetical protein
VAFSRRWFLDVLSNNAGNMLSGLVEKTTLEQGRNQFEATFWAQDNSPKLFAIFPKAA